jgi:hypothetical protein
MLSEFDATVIALCLEGFLYGKISVLCALICAKEVHLFPNLGLYSGIFAMFLQCSQNKSRMASIIFYALCVLYVLSTVNVVLDLMNNIIQANNNSESIRKNIIFLISCAFELIDVESIQVVVYRISIIQVTTSGCCDFLAQCILVRINLYIYQLNAIVCFIHLNLQRSTVVGSCGVKISVS